MIDLTSYGNKMMFEELDAYGHLAYSVGTDEVLICADFVIWRNVDRGILVAYHVVIDAEPSSYCGVLEESVTPLSEFGDLNEFDWCPLEEHSDSVFQQMPVDTGSVEVIDLLDEIYRVKQQWKKSFLAEAFLIIGEEADLQAEGMLYA